MFQHRTSRALFAKSAGGKSVLDLYCHTGSFARLAAAVSNSSGNPVTGKRILHYLKHLVFTNIQILHVGGCVVIVVFVCIVSGCGRQ